MGKRIVQGCLAGCVMDCYFFGCVEREKCDQFKRFEKGERIRPDGTVEQSIEGKENGV